MFNKLAKVVAATYKYSYGQKTVVSNKVKYASSLSAIKALLFLRINKIFKKKHTKKLYIFLTILDWKNTRIWHKMIFENKHWQLFTTKGTVL